MAVDGIHGTQVHQQFGDERFVKDEVGQGDVLAAEQTAVEVIGPLAAVEAVTGDLGRSQQGGLKGSGARGDQRGACMMHQRIGGIAQHGNGIGAHHFAVKLVVDAGGTGNDGLILRMTCCRLEHQGQVVANFPHAGSGHKGDNGTVGQAVFFT